MLISASLIQGVKGLEDVGWDWADTGRRRVPILICRELLYQSKVEFSHLVVPGVMGPQSCEYLVDGTKVMSHGPFPDD